MIWLFALLACDGGFSSSGTELEIDCMGMIYTDMSTDDGSIDKAKVTSAMTTIDKETGDSFYRCVWGTSVVIDESAQIGNEIPIAIVGNKVVPMFFIDGVQYLSVGGDVEFSKFTSYKNVVGTYEITAMPIDGGDIVKIKGEFSWCQYDTEDSCPFTPVDPIEKRFELEAVGVGAVEGGVTQCNLIHDPNNETLWLELQYGTIAGSNVGRYLAPECGLVLPANHLRFMAAGVPAPGAYGPYLVSPDEDGQLLPFLEAVRPASMERSHVQCTFQDLVSITTVEEGEFCEFSFSEDEVEIYCDEASYVVPPLDWGWGSFSLRADCDLITL